MGVRKSLSTTGSPKFMLSTQNTLNKPKGSMILHWVVKKTNYIIL